MKSVAIDLETSGLDYQSNILSVGAAANFGGPDATRPYHTRSWLLGSQDLFAQPAPLPLVVDELKTLIDQADVVYLHNAAFDLAFLFGQGLLRPTTIQGKLCDTLLTGRMTGPRESVSLAALCDAYQIGDDRWRNLKNLRSKLNAVAIQTLLEYNELDALYTLQLGECLWRESVALYGADFTFRESDYCRIMAAIRVRGKALDPDATTAAMQRLLRARRRILKFVLFPRRIEGPNDRTGLIKFLKAQGFSQFRLTAKGNESVAKNELDLIIAQLERVSNGKKTPALTACRAVRKLRHIEKIVGTYLDPLLHEHADADFLVHPAYTVGGTVTYRLSSSHPNGQNMPRELNKILWRPYLSADYSQAELRLAAAYAQEPALANAFAQGLDVHLDTATRMFGKERAKEMRPIAKNINFCVPLETEALTPDGWKRHDQLQIGDLVLGHQPQAEETRLVWTPIEAITHLPAAPLVHLHNAYWSAIVTPDHRWWAKKRRDGGRRGRYTEYGFVATDKISPEHTLLLSFPATTEQRLPISAQEAAVIAYLWVEGRIERGVFTGAPAQAGGKRVKFVGHIHQSKPQGRREIERTLADIPHKVYARAQDSLLTYSLDREWLRDVWQRARLDELTYDQFVLALGVTERHAFFHAVLVAEGCQTQNLFSTNHGPLLEALRLCAFLEGYLPSNGGAQKCANVTLGKPYVTGQRLIIEPAETTPVFCLQTGTGSWVMRQGTTISLTGNCALYGGGPKTLSERFGVPLDQAAEFVRLHRQVYPRLHKYTRIAQDAWQSRGYVKLISGKRLYATKEDLLRGYKAFNNIIQGGVGELVKEAMLQLDALGIPMIGQIHDAIEFPLGVDQEPIAQVMDNILPDAIASRTNPPIRMRVDFEQKGTAHVSA